MKGFGELIPCLVLTEREERGLPCEDLAVHFATCYRVMRLEVIQKIIRWCSGGTFGGVAGSMSAVSGTVKSLVPALRLLFRWLR